LEPRQPATKKERRGRQRREEESHGQLSSKVRGKRAKTLEERIGDKK